MDFYSKYAHVTPEQQAQYYQEDMTEIYGPNFLKRHETTLTIGKCSEKRRVNSNTKAKKGLKKKSADLEKKSVMEAEKTVDPEMLEVAEILLWLSENPRVVPLSPLPEIIIHKVPRGYEIPAFVHLDNRVY